MNKLSGLLAILAIVATFAACSSTESVSTDSSSKSDSIYPAWYSTSAFTSDSLSFYSNATSVDTDSSASISKATQQARVNLDRELGTKIEGIRETLEESGNADVDNTDYFIILRKAHQDISSKATIAEVSTTKKDGVYRSFVQLTLSKSAADSHLQNGFNGHPRYWGALSGSEGYKSLFN